MTRIHGNRRKTNLGGISSIPSEQDVTLVAGSPLACNPHSTVVFAYVFPIVRTGGPLDVGPR
jgi:hypothetical protein